jgi:hypothetical protein
LLAAARALRHWWGGKPMASSCSMLRAQLP